MLLDIVERYPPICQCLSSHLDTRSLIYLKRSSRRFEIVLKSAWNINARLKRFVKKPVDLRTLLGRHDGLISGSFALQFLERVEWADSDLDIFIEKGTGSIALAEYIVAQEGYILQSTTNHTEYAENMRAGDLTETNTYLRRNDYGYTSKIQIVCTQSIPIQAILRGFYTTAIVNIITWNKAFALFPDATFLERKTYMLNFGISDYFGPLLSKYSQRGYRPLELQWVEDRHPAHSIQTIGPRRVGDRKSWQMLLDSTGVSKPSTPDFVIEHAEFVLRKRSSARFYEIQASHFASCVLRYKYTFCDYSPNAQDSRGFWLGFVADKVEELTKMEFWMMKPIDRPPTWDTEFGGGRTQRYTLEGTFKKPSTWRYWDDYIPKWQQLWDETSLKTG